MISIALVCIYAVFWVCWGKLMAVEKTLSKMEGEIDKMWSRIEWLCRDTDDRLSVDRLEFQQKSKQIRNLWKRLRYVERRLYIEPGDAFKEKEDGK